MAQPAHGVGVSGKAPDGTMFWSFREDWAQVIEDVGKACGGDAVFAINESLQRVWEPVATVTPIEVGQIQTGAEAANEEWTQEQTAFDACPKCGKPKNKLVPAGKSKRPPFKAYPAFYACQTPGCPGR